MSLCPSIGIDRPVTINRQEIEAPPSLGNGEMPELVLPVQLLVDLFLFFLPFSLISFYQTILRIFKLKDNGPCGFGYRLVFVIRTSSIWLPFLDRGRGPMKSEHCSV